MKKIHLAALGTAMMMLLTGCDAIRHAQEISSPTEAETAVTFTVYQALPLPNLYVEIPEEYEVTSSDFYKEYYISEDASIIITEDASGAPYGDVHDYVIKAIAQYQSITDTLEILSNESVDGTDRSVETLEFTYTLGEEEPLELTSLVGFLSNTYNMYLITCKCSTENYAQHREEFLSVIRSAHVME